MPTRKVKISRPEPDSVSQVDTDALSALSPLPPSQTQWATPVARPDSVVKPERGSIPEPITASEPGVTPVIRSAVSRRKLYVLLFCLEVTIVGALAGTWLYASGQLPSLVLTVALAVGTVITFFAAIWAHIEKILPKGIWQHVKRLPKMATIGVLLAGLITVGGFIGLVDLAHTPSIAAHTSTMRVIPAPSSGKLLYTYSLYPGYYVNNVAWSPDGRYIASANGDGTVWVLDALNGGNVNTYHNDACRSHTCWFNAVAWSPDSSRIAAASADGTVQVLDASTGVLLLTYRGHSHGVWAVAWSPDGKRIASSGHDGTVQVWQASTGVLLLTYHGHKGGVWGVTWSPDGNDIASAGNDGTVQVWNATTGDVIYVYHGHFGPVYEVAWSPDGKRIASASADKTVQMWDAYSGAHIYTYRGHRDPVQAVKWSPDGQRIASGSLDGTVQIWQDSTGVLLFTYHGHVSGVFGVDWSPDGNDIASGGNDGSVQVWQVR